MYQMIMERLQDVIRRMNLLIETGVIEAINPEGKVKVRLDPERITPYIQAIIPRAHQDIAWHPLDIGEHVLLLCPSGELSRSFVIGSLKTQTQPSPSTDLNTRAFQFKDGALFQYNRDSHKLLIQLPEPATTEVVSKGGITFIGDTHIQGELTVDKDTLLKSELTVNSNTQLNSHLKVAGMQENKSVIKSDGDQIAGGISQMLHIHKVERHSVTTPPK